MSFLATWKNHEQNRVFKLTNKILLFQYSKGIFSDHNRPVTFTLAHNTQLIALFPTRYKMSRNTYFLQRYKGMNIETIEIG